MKNTARSLIIAAKMNPLIKQLGSLAFALFLIAALGILLIVSTLLESKYGTPFAQKIFYQAGWFDVFLGLVAVNITCSALSRWPYKLKHTGFLLTHTGILILLVGSLISRLAGVEGQLMLFESEKSSLLRQSEYELIAHKHGSQTLKADLREKPGSALLDLGSFEEGLKVWVDRVSENSRKVSRIAEGTDADPLNAAVEVSLESGLAGFKDSFWLVEKDGSDPLSSEKQLGPARFFLKRQARERMPDGTWLFIRPRRGADEIAVDLTKIRGEMPLDGGYTIRDLRYYPDARVSDKNELVSISEKPLNPAVELKLVDPSGKTRKAAHFAFFPQFDSMHNRQSDPERPELRLEFPGSDDALPAPWLAFITDGSGWSYKSRSSKTSSDGALEAGKTYETGWMDIHFQPKQLFSRAVVSQKVENLEEGIGNLAAHLVIRKNGKVLWEDWALEEDPVSPGGSLEGTVLVVRRKSLELPFSLTLKDFRKVDYPGTRNAMSFESDVALEDEAERIAIHRTISMNKPLDYKGYRIFQSSFVQNEMSGEASVFTIAKNPGIGLIYAGSIVMFIGILFVFFVKPLSSFNQL